jgi:hypothetical protein
VSSRADPGSSGSSDTGGARDPGPPEPDIDPEECRIAGKLRDEYDKAFAEQSQTMARRKRDPDEMLVVRKWVAENVIPMRPDERRRFMAAFPMAAHTFLGLRDDFESKHKHNFPYFLKHYSRWEQQNAPPAARRAPVRNVMDIADRLR